MHQESGSGSLCSRAVVTVLLTVPGWLPGEVMARFFAAACPEG